MSIVHQGISAGGLQTPQSSCKTKTKKTTKSPTQTLFPPDCPNDVSPCDFTKYYGSAAEYVAAYTHLRQLWDGLGVSNVTYVIVWSEALWGSNAALAQS